MRIRVLSVISSALVCACHSGEGGDAASSDTDATSVTESGPGSTGDTASTTGSATSSDSTAGTTMASTDTGESESAGETDTGDPMNDVCARWNEDRADMSEGTWSGSVQSCNAGDISGDGRANALKIMNLYRSLADLPPVTTNAQRDAAAQACALLMHANEQLSHDPPQNWTCWSSAGQQGASKSNIAGTAGVAAVDLYMVDPGNPTTLGHRRWILSNSIGPTGLGSTSEYSCMWTLDGTGKAGKAWTAWPPPGSFPFEAVAPSWTGIDETGWSIQSDDIDLTGAQVTITSDGETLPVTVTVLAKNYGSDFAISMIPSGWETEPGRSYHVEVTGIARTISYDVDVVACR